MAIEKGFEFVLLCEFRFVCVGREEKLLTWKDPFLPTYDPINIAAMPVKVPSIQRTGLRETKTKKY